MRSATLTVKSDCVTVFIADPNGDLPIRIIDFKTALCEYSREHATTHCAVERGGSISLRNENAFAGLTILTPFHGYAVRGVLRGSSKPLRNKTRPKVLEPNHAHAADGIAVVKLGPERRRNGSRHHFRIDAKVKQHSTRDDAVDHIQQHRLLFPDPARGGK